MQRSAARHAIERAGKYLLEEVWAAGAGSASRFRRFAVSVVRVCIITVQGFIQDLCLLRASALTFASLMAFVPVLAIGFSIVRGLGWHGQRLEAFILGKATMLSPGAIKLIVSYVDNTSFTALGAAGGSVLFVTFVSVMTNIEVSFNAIWGGVQRRTLARRIIDYFGVMVIAPVLLVVATSMTAAVQSNSIVVWLRNAWGLGLAVEYAIGYAAYTIVWLLFAFMYVFVPNTRVRIVPALIGGVIAGTVWQLTQWTYIRFQFGMARYNAIYGALAQLPLLMAWVYMSWVIVLLGAEISFAIQNIGSFSRERRSAQATAYGFREYAGLTIVSELADAAEGKDGAPTIEALSTSLDLPVKLVRELLASLSLAGLAHAAGDGDERCYLSLAPERIPVARVLDVLRGGRVERLGIELSDSELKARGVVERVAKARDQALEGMTVKDLATLLEG